MDGFAPAVLVFTPGFDFKLVVVGLAAVLGVEEGFVGLVVVVVVVEVLTGPFLTSFTVFVVVVFIGAMPVLVVVVVFFTVVVVVVVVFGFALCGREVGVLVAPSGLSLGFAL